MLFSLHTRLIAQKKDTKPIGISKFGIYIKSAFSRVCARKLRYKFYWTKSEQIYRDIANKEVCASVSVTPSDIKHKLPSDFFVFNLLKESVTLGFYPGYICDGNKIIIEIHILASGGISACLASKPIQLSSVYIPEIIDMVSSNVIALLTAFKSIPICCGVDENTGNETWRVPQSGKMLNTSRAYDCERTYKIIRRSHFFDACKSISSNPDDTYDNKPKKLCSDKQCDPKPLSCQT